MIRSECDALTSEDDALLWGRTQGPFVPRGRCHGAFYEVSDQGNLFAAKTLLRDVEVGPEAMARFVGEGSTSTLDSPNVISVFDAAMGPMMEVHFLVMLLKPNLS
ncbi:MAG: hypothetical protein WCI05_17915 [Myxococcales bacterium]